MTCSTYDLNLPLLSHCTGDVNLRSRVNTSLPLFNGVNVWSASGQETGFWRRTLYAEGADLRRAVVHVAERADVQHRIADQRQPRVVDLPHRRVPARTM